MLKIYSPYSNEVVGSVKSCTVEDINDAVGLLKKYKFEINGYERSKLINIAATKLDEHRDEFINIIIDEIGISYKDASHEVDRSVNVLKICAEESKRIQGEITPSEISEGFHDKLIYSVREPIGIVLCITPFNHPLNQVVHKIMPALAANNAVLLKPSRKCPLTAIKLIELLYDSGFPKEMLQIITGEDAVIGRELVSNPDINMISFTGSVPTGKKIAAWSGIKKTSFELGGNDALVIDNSADLDHAAQVACDGAFKNSGQRCSSTKRIIIQSEIKNEFLKKFKLITENLKVGDPKDISTDIGTVIDVDAAKVIEGRINNAIEEGAKVIIGGKRKNAQIEPTIIDNVNMNMEIVAEETFGPIAPIITVETFNHAIEIVNSTLFGLNSALISNDHKHINHFIKSVITGGIRINEASSFRNEMLPYGGTKISGYGRGGIRYAMKEMSNLKTILM